MTNYENNADTWKLSIEEYEKANWGQINPKFQVSDSFIRRFRKTFYFDSEGNEIPEPTEDSFTGEKTDLERIFKVMANYCIDAIITTYQPLQNIQYGWINAFPNAQRDLRYAVYCAIEHNIYNDTFWERVAPTSVSAGSFNFSQGGSMVSMPRDVLGQKALRKLEQHKFEEIEWIDIDENAKVNAYVVKNNGVIIGKTNIENIPNLGE